MTGSKKQYSEKIPVCRNANGVKGTLINSFIAFQNDLKAHFHNSKTNAALCRINDQRIPMLFSLLLLP